MENPTKPSHTDGSHQAVRTTVHLTTTSDLDAIRDGRKKYVAAFASQPFREHDMVIIRTVSGQELHRKITYIETVEQYQILSLKKV